MINELRIGNYVYEKFYKSIVITQIDLDDMAGLREIFLYKKPLPFSPIPITQNILFDLGFDLRFNYFRRDNITIVFCPSSKVIFNGLILSHIDSVHKLQNLYYDSYNKELTL
ncbi:MAG: hypothetical protein QNK20_01545 [Aureibaculum sp.]|nr:hypothetical protein [Aureibaculum sp.]